MLPNTADGSLKRGGESCGGGEGKTEITGRRERKFREQTERSAKE